MGDDQQTPSIDYHHLIQESLRSVVRELLRRVERDGLPSPHHFYLTFDTSHPGVELSAELAASYPEEMTIVLEHQFWELEAAKDGFAVDLSFGGQRQRLSVPYAALTSFVDPAAEIGLRFGEAAKAELSSETTKAPEPAEGPGGNGVTPNVVPIDRFRRD